MVEPGLWQVGTGMTAPMTHQRLGRKIVLVVGSDQGTKDLVPVMVSAYSKQL